MKYLFFDIDGTLVGKSRKITERTLNAIKLAKEQGHKVFIATGRAPTTISDDIWHLDVDGYICSAGSYIFVEGKLIYQHQIEQSQLKETLSLFEEYQMHYTLECIDCLYESKGNNAFFERINQRKFKDNLELLRHFAVHRTKQKRKPIHTFNYEIPVSKVDFISPKKRVLEIEETLSKNYYVVYFKEEDTFINGEIICKDCTKADGIERVVNYYKGDIKDTIAFGDTMNDYQMLEKAAVAVCYKGANDKLQALCDYTFDDPDKLGVYQTMKEMELI